METLRLFETIKKTMQSTKINRNSEIINKKKLENLLIKNEENENKDAGLDFDLWPEINKLNVNENIQDIHIDNLNDFGEDIDFDTHL